MGRKRVLLLGLRFFLVGNDLKHLLAAKLLGEMQGSKGIDFVIRGHGNEFSQSIQGDTVRKRLIQDISKIRRESGQIGLGNVRTVVVHQQHRNPGVL